MNSQKLVTLAACASKSSQEAKRAEAHARASRVYAKKVVFLIELHIAVKRC